MQAIRQASCQLINHGSSQVAEADTAPELPEPTILARLTELLKVAALWERADLEQEHVLGAVAAVDGELARALLGGYHVQLRRKCRDGHHWLPRYIRARHRQLQTLQAKNNTIISSLYLG